MTAHAHTTHFHTDCKVVEINGSRHFTGTFAVQTDIPSSPAELDQIIDISTQIGRKVQQTVAITSIEHADGQIAALACTVNSQMRKHGHRPFSILTPFGRLVVKRQRLFNPTTGKTSIPSALLWKTAHHRHLATSLAQSACDAAQETSFRKSKKQLCEAAQCETLLSHSTVWNLKQAEEARLEAKQQHFMDIVLAEHGETLKLHGFLPPPVAEESEPENVEEAEETIAMEALAMYQYFTSQVPEKQEPNERTVEKNPDKSPETKGTKKRCHVPKDTLLLQADEVVTKSQEKGCKTNKTFTATVEDGNGRCEYLAACTSYSLQILVAAVLILWGLFKGKKLEVISDGAAWIGNWITGLCGLDVYHLLCWYHLSKRVCVGLSGLGFSKTERLLYQKEILGHLWHGRVSEAIKILKELVPRSRVPERVEELIDYLVRKRYMIGDYAQRHELGLWIASTRVEKWNDTAVSERCKHRGMSWTVSGVMAMALAACENKRKTTQTAQINAAVHTSP